jgi:hypothetical protein
MNRSVCNEIATLDSHVLGACHEKSPMSGWYGQAEPQSGSGMMLEIEIFKPLLDNVCVDLGR